MGASRTVLLELFLEIVLQDRIINNMTANIMDVPVNVLEMAARVEGVETLIEDLFGPYGYFPDDGIMKIFNVTFTKDDVEKLRTRRSVDSDVDDSVSEMHKKVKYLLEFHLLVFSPKRVFWSILASL